MATPVETTATFNALTEDYILPGIHDQIFTGTPLLKELGEKIQGFTGEKFTGKVQIGEITNHWYDPDADLDADVDFTTPDIATEFEYNLKYSEEGIRLPVHQVDRQGRESNIKMLDRYTDVARRSLRKDLNSALVAVSGSGPGNHSANQPTSLWDICNDHNAEYGCATIGGITADGTGNGYWRAHIMEGQDTYATAVSPSLQNVENLLDDIMYSVGEPPDLFVVDRAYYKVLRAQLLPIEIHTQSPEHNRFVDWGFDSFKIRGVPVIWDRNMPGLTYVGGTDRHTCGGSELLAINWATMYGIKDDKWNFKFHPEGWWLTKVKQTLQYLNTLHCWINFVTEMRRAQGHIFNVDITQDPADFTDGVVTLPEVA